MSKIIPGMTPTTEAGPESGAGRMYLLVILCEVACVAALWFLGRFFA